MRLSPASSSLTFRRTSEAQIKAALGVLEGLRGAAGSWHTGRLQLLAYKRMANIKIFAKTLDKYYNMCYYFIVRREKHEELLIKGGHTKTAGGRLV